MQYRTQAQIVDQIEMRLNNRTTVTFPWSAIEVRQAIQQAVGLSFPVGTPAVVTMSKADYDANPQKYAIDAATSAVPPAPGLLHVRQLEVRNSTGQPTLLTRGQHYQISSHGAQFLYLFQGMGTGETLRLDAILGVAEPDGTDADDSDVIKLDTPLVLAYACYVLLQMNSRTGTVSSRADEQLLARDYLAQAESRKAFLFQQQYGSAFETEQDRKK